MRRGPRRAIIDTWTSLFTSPRSRTPTHSSAGARWPRSSACCSTSRSPWSGRSRARTIAQRLGADDLDAHEIASYDPEAFAEVLSTKPAVHRYPGSMAKRIQQLCQYLVEHYDGDASAVWEGVKDGRELLKRLNDLPGFGTQKAQIFLALLGKQLGVRPRAGARPRARTARRSPSGRSRTSRDPTRSRRCGRTSRR